MSIYSDGEEIFKKRERVKRAGKRFLGIMVFIGFLGALFWKWYAILISLGLTILIGSLYSVMTGKKIEKEMGLDIHGQERALNEYLYQRAESDYRNEFLDEEEP